MDFLQNPITAGFIIPFIVEALKSKINISSKVLPLVVFAVGMLYGLLEFYVPGGSTEMVQAMIGGVYAAGIATGVYDIKKGLFPEGNV